LTTADDPMVRVYRLFLLALADRPSFSAMNLIRESVLGELSDVQKWLLASAYHLSGMERAASEILLEAGTSVVAYNESGGTYGSDLRDLAMIMDAAMVIGRWSVADRLYAEVSDALATEAWYSTQTTGYCLMALGRYADAQSAGLDAPVEGRLLLPGGNQISFSVADEPFVHSLTEGFGERFEVLLDGGGDQRVFVGYEWEGIALRVEGKETSSGLALTVAWYDEAGNIVDPAEVRQGSEFWGHLRVTKTVSYRTDLEEIAVSAMIPAGWEIQNIRLTGEPFPSWSREWRLGLEEYTDIRDDRIVWFLDLPAQQRQADFLVKVRAVTAGTFALPPAVCEAMYRSDFRATAPGRTVVVRSAE
jgi:uncharacterized protein YfaS (alpha-2-macroglobulin family)